MQYYLTAHASKSQWNSILGKQYLPLQSRGGWWRSTGLPILFLPAQLPFISWERFASLCSPSANRSFLWAELSAFQVRGVMRSKCGQPSRLVGCSPLVFQTRHTSHRFDEGCRGCSLAYSLFHVKQLPFTLKFFSWQKNSNSCMRVWAENFWALISEMSGDRIDECKAFLPTINSKKNCLEVQYIL